MQTIKLIKEKRKTYILKTTVFGCLKSIPAINITRGCLHSCVYCYARGFTNAPPKGEVHLYENLAEMLEWELSRRRRLPSRVFFSTASDAFQAVDEILEITYRVMRIILEKGIGILFLTKGFIPPDFIELFKKYHNLVKASVGILSLDEDYIRLFEPFSAPPLRRLSNIRDLISAGIDTTVRIDPLIPYLVKKGNTGFSEESIEQLVKRLKAVDVKCISISSLVMRPSIVNQFIKELPLRLAKEILNQYNGQPYQKVITSAKTKLLPKTTRIAQYKMIKDIANRYGINCYICGCKNPDLPREFCNHSSFFGTFPLFSQ